MYISTLIDLFTPHPHLYFSPDLSKITRRKQHFDHQLGRRPTVAVYKENQHKFYLHVFHWPPGIHHTYLKGAALEQLVLLAFRTIQERIYRAPQFAESPPLAWLRDQFSRATQWAPKCCHGSTEPHESFKHSVSSHLPFSHSIPSQASGSPFARSYCGGRLSGCRGFW